MSRQDRLVRLTIPAKAEYITLGRLALTAIARVRPLSQETLSDLKLSNIIYDPSGRRSIAVMRDMTNNAQYRVTTGSTSVASGSAPWSMD